MTNFELVKLANYLLHLTFEHPVLLLSIKRIKAKYQKRKTKIQFTFIDETIYYYYSDVSNKRVVPNKRAVTKLQFLLTCIFTYCYGVPNKQEFMDFFPSDK